MKNFDSVTLFEQAMVALPFFFILMFRQYFRRQRLSWLAFRSELLTTFETDSGDKMIGLSFSFG